MQIILNNGNELTPIMISGGPRNVQGVQRDTLDFVFPAEVGMDALDATFTEAACESIHIVDDDGGEFIHKGYTIRVGLSKARVEIEKATTDTEAVYEDRITVSMSQRTYTENQIAALTETVDTLVMENLMA